MASFLETAIEIAREAGALVSNMAERGIPFELKGEFDLVTAADKASEALIVERLQTYFPSHTIVGEEGGQRDRQGEYCWYVDPVDGTTNFAHGHPFWCVSIGLVDRGVPVAGAVVAPALAVEWVGSVGDAARRNGEPCTVSVADSLEDALLATGFPYDRRTSPDDNLDAFVAMKKRARGVRRCGSAALDLCLVADGSYDGYWEQKLAPWDLCAGAGIVRAAGGTLTDYDGGPVAVRPGRVIATNGVIHDELMREVQAARR